jgi:hypothetical protein
MRFSRALPGAVLLMTPALLAAQSTELELATGAVTFPTPTAAHFASWPPSASGPVTDSVAVPYVVYRNANLTIRVTTVLIRCTGVAGGKACGDIEWRNGPSGPWRALTTGNEEVESRTVFPLLFNDPWGGTLWLRFRVSLGDPAPALITSNIALTLSVYRP